MLVPKPALFRPFTCLVFSLSKQPLQQADSHRQNENMKPFQIRVILPEPCELLYLAIYLTIMIEYVPTVNQGYA
jgi:hypothetical protein